MQRYLSYAFITNMYCISNKILLTSSIGGKITKINV